MIIHSGIIVLCGHIFKNYHYCTNPLTTTIKIVIQITVLLGNHWKTDNSTVIPHLARFLWQPKNRVRWNSCYASLYYDLKKFWKILKNICIALYSISIKSCYENYFLQPQKFVLCKFVLWKTVLAEGWL